MCVDGKIAGVQCIKACGTPCRKICCKRVALCANAHLMQSLPKFLGDGIVGSKSCEESHGLGSLLLEGWSILACSVG